MLKRYLVFYGDMYYPLRGMGDFKSDFDSLQEAYFFLRDIHKNSFDTYAIENERWENKWDEITVWGVIYDSLTKTPVWESDESSDVFYDILKTYEH